MAANKTITKALGVFAGPIGMTINGLWAAIDLAGPAFRLTIPAIVTVASMRAMHYQTEDG